MEVAVGWDGAYEGSPRPTGTAIRRVMTPDIEHQFTTSYDRGEEASGWNSVTIRSRWRGPIHTGMICSREHEAGDA